MARALFIGLESRVLLSGTGEQETSHEDQTPGSSIVVDDDSQHQDSTTEVDPAKQAVLDALAELKANYQANKKLLDAARRELANDREALAKRIKRERAALRDQAQTLEQQAVGAARAEAKLEKKWKSTLAADDQDVATKDEGESKAEQRRDKERQAANRAQYKKDRAALKAKLKSDRDAINADYKSAIDALKAEKKRLEAEITAGEKAVSKAKKALQNTFQSDRKILMDQLEQYEDQGGSADDVDLSELPES